MGTCVKIQPIGKSKPHLLHTSKPPIYRVLKVQHIVSWAAVLVVGVQQTLGHGRASKCSLEHKLCGLWCACVCVCLYHRCLFKATAEVFNPTSHELSVFFSCEGLGEGAFKNHTQAAKHVFYILGTTFYIQVELQIRRNCKRQHQATSELRNTNSWPRVEPSGGGGCGMHQFPNIKLARPSVLNQRVGMVGVTCTNVQINISKVF